MSTATLPKGRTAPKGDPTPKQVKRNLPPTMMRRYHGRDHLPPTKGVWFLDQDHRLWHGHSRHAHPLRRKANKRTWAKLVRDRRRGWAIEREATAREALTEGMDLKPWQKKILGDVLDGATVLLPPQQGRRRRGKK